MTNVDPASQLSISVDDSDMLVAVESLAWRLAGMVVTVTTLAGAQIELTIDEANPLRVRQRLPGDDGHEILPVGGHGFSPGMAI